MRANRAIYLTGLVAFLLGCGNLLTDLDRIIALELRNLQVSVEEADTIRLSAVALDARGDTVDVPITWAVIDTGRVGFVLDTATGLITGTGPGTGRVIARSANLRSGEVVVTVTPAPDSLAPADTTTLTVPAGTVQSSALAVTVLDLTTLPGTASVLSAKPVTFSVVSPSAPASVTLVGSSGTVGTDPHTIDVVSSGNGQAASFVRVLAGQTPPDTVRVNASAVTRSGAPVAGSPVSFTIIFAPSP